MPNLESYGGSTCLRSLHESEAFRPLAFAGGTALLTREHLEQLLQG